jgi:hypothetical protein
MELEGFKSAWQKQSVEGHPLSSRLRNSRSLQFLRTSAIHDLQRSEELSRLVFSLLFALVLIGVSVVLMSPGPGRVASWIFAAALLVDGLAGVTLLAHRLREPVTTTVLEFISREHRHVEARLRVERYSQRLIFALGAVALLVLILSPRPLDSRANAFDVLGRMAVVTAFLAFAWRRVKSRSLETRRELERYLEDLSDQ